MKSVNPYLNFNGNAEEAFKFYQRVFGGEVHTVRYKDLDDNMGLTGDDLNKVANAMLPIVGDTVLYGSDAPGKFDHTFRTGDSIQINIEAESRDEAEQLFNNLSDGGDIKMPMQETEWAERFGMLSDKFGVQWMVGFTGDKDV